MFYFNPYRLLHLEPDSPEAVNGSLLRQAKRRLLAEFELGGEVAIEVQGVALDKSQALGLLDELEDTDRKQYHWRVLQNPELMTVLTNPENGSLGAIPEWNDLSDQGFRTFLSPFLADVLSWRMSEAIRTKGYHLLEEIVAKTPVLLARDLDQVFDAALRKANQGMVELAHWTENPKAIRKEQKELWALIDRNFLLGLNVLPSRFQNLRNRYAKVLVDLAVAIKNELNQRFLASRVILNADLLKVDVHVKMKVEHVLHQLVRYKPEQKNLKPRPPREPGTKRQFRLLRLLRNGLIILLSLVVLFFFLGLYIENTRYIPSPKAQPDTLLNLKYAQRIRLFNQLNEYSFEKKPIGLIPTSSTPSSQRMHGRQPYAHILGAKTTPNIGSRPYVFRNDSPLDAVFILMPDHPEEESIHFYVSANNQLAFQSSFEGGMTLHTYTGEEWQSRVLTYYTHEELLYLGAFKHSPYRLSIEKVDQDSVLCLETNVLEARWLQDNPVAEQMGMSLDSPVVFILEQGLLYKKENK